MDRVLAASMAVVQLKNPLKPCDTEETGRVKMSFGTEGEEQHFGKFASDETPHEPTHDFSRGQDGGQTEVPEKAKEL